MGDLPTFLRWRHKGLGDQRMLLQELQEFGCGVKSQSGAFSSGCGLQGSLGCMMMGSGGEGSSPRGTVAPERLDARRPLG